MYEGIIYGFAGIGIAMTAQSFGWLAWMAVNSVVARFKPAPPPSIIIPMTEREIFEARLKSAFAQNAGRMRIFTEGD